MRNLFIGLSILIFSSGAFAAEGDVARGADHALTGRFEGSVISYYKAVDFDGYRFLTGPVQGRGSDEASRRVEGAMVRIAYVFPAGTTPLQVVRNFEQRLEENGLEIDYSCGAEECGLNDFVSATEVLPIPHMNVDPWNFTYLAAHGTVQGANIYVTVLASFGGDGKTRGQVIVVEEEAMAYEMIDAEALAKGLDTDGHIAIYNIYFDTNEARLKAESAGALGEVAKLMSLNPELELIVVGHTDNVGTLSYNEDLSKRRAAVVVSELTSAYGISRSRLTPAGVGMYAPVASNQDEAGRALNRRVELVRR
jgi:outer membrane protein OmpA-like peptidoglycan-associated protein